MNADIKFLKKQNFKMLIDIGANNGDYALHLKNLFKIPNVLCFEPLPHCSAPLKEKGFEVFSLALSSFKGHGEFIINSYDAASSLYSLTEITTSEWPEVSEQEVIHVNLDCLDNYLEKIKTPLLIKIDAQGAEAEIIDGGNKVLSEASVILIECCFVPLYKNQPLFHEIHYRLSKLDFIFAGIKMQYVGKDGMPLFAHLIYTQL